MILTLQELGVYEELQDEEEHHQEDTGHQDAVEARAEQTHLPQSHAPAAARPQPVRAGGGREGLDGEVWCRITRHWSDSSSPSASERRNPWPISFY